MTSITPKNDPLASSGNFPVPSGNIKEDSLLQTSKSVSFEIQNKQTIQDGPNKWTVSGEIVLKTGEKEERYCMTVYSDTSEEEAMRFLQEHAFKAAVTCAVKGAPLQLTGENFEHVQKGRWDGANVKYEGRIKTIPATAEEVVEQAKEKITQKQKFYQNPKLKECCERLNSSSQEKPFSGFESTYADYAKGLKRQGLKGADLLIDNFCKLLDCENHPEARRTLEKFFDRKIPTEAEIEQKISKWGDEGTKNKNLETAMKILKFAASNNNRESHSPLSQNAPTSTIRQISSSGPDLHHNGTKPVGEFRSEVGRNSLLNIGRLTPYVRDPTTLSTQLSAPGILKDASLQENNLAFFRDDILGPNETFSSDPDVKDAPAPMSSPIDGINAANRHHEDALTEIRELMVKENLDTSEIERIKDLYNALDSKQIEALTESEEDFINRCLSKD